MPKLQVTPQVFFTSVIALGAFLAVGVLAPEWTQEALPAALTWVTEHFAWLYVSSVAGFIGFCVWLLFTRYRNLRLGPDGSMPEYPRMAWFAMLFSAGMGIGLVFYGVAEPMYHFQAPPLGEGATRLAASNALPLSIFHWGLHAWAIYAVVGLCIAYFHYRRGLPLALRSCFRPLVGDHIHGWFGHMVDILAVLGTLFGLATSLALGAMQVSAGLEHLFDLPSGKTTQIVLIGLLTGAATISLVTGVSKGIRRLSELNLIAAGCLLIFTFLVGPTLFITTGIVEGIGQYVEVILDRSLALGLVNNQEQGWVNTWTVFYWGWWISWAPFVGMFIARISKGRTIREFILGVLLVPTIVTIVWFGVFGGTALELQLEGTLDVAGAVAERVETATYVTLGTLPFGTIAAFLSALVVIIFFVTSSDSASFVVDMLASGGHPNPPKWQRVFWASLEGSVAAALVYTSSKASIKGLQAGVICIGLPFCILLIMMCVSLVKALRQNEQVHIEPPPVKPD